MLRVNETIRKLLAVFLLIAICLFTSPISSKESIASETSAHQSLKQLGKQLACEHEMCLLDYGKGQDLVETPACRWCLNFMSQQMMTIDEAHPIISDMAQQMLHQLYEDTTYQCFLTSISQKYIHISPELSIDLVGFRIGFWNQCMDRPNFPYLAQVRFAEGKLFYYYADSETKILLEPIVRPLFLKER